MDPVIWQPVASLRLVSPGAVTCGVVLYFSSKTDHLFNIVATPTLSAFQVIVCPVFFVNSAAKKFRVLLGCHPLDGVTRGGPPFPPP